MDANSNHSLKDMEAEVAKRRADQAEAEWYPGDGPAKSPDVSAAESEWHNPFVDFDTAWHPDASKAHAAAREWVYAVSSGQVRGLVLWSDNHHEQSGYGSGKTTLARMAYEVLRVMRSHNGQAQRVRFINAADLFQDIKDAYSNNAPVAPMFDDWTRGHFILDDWSKQYTTATGEEWAREQFYKLINRLVEAGHGLLMTSNSAPATIERQIGGASWSRLLGMCGPRGFIDMSAVPDYRLKRAGF